MDSNKRGRLVALMSAMAEGDKAAVFTLHEEFRPELAASVRRSARRFGVDLSAQDVGDLTVDAALAVFDVAGSWTENGGALPWVWAERRIHSIVGRHIGQFADPLDSETAEEVAALVAGPSSEPDEVAVLEALACLSPRCRLFLDALQLVASPRNQAVILAFRVQKAMGDPSPAATVGQSFDLKPEAVRQIVHRGRQALRELVASNARFAELGDMGWLS